MDHQDLRILKILEALDEDQNHSQRDLARKLNVSLGLVNSFIKRLAQKGYFKITTIPKNRVRYILTPKGLAEKTRLSCEYIYFSFEFYKKARQQLRNLFRNLGLQGVTKVALYGANDYAEIAFITLQETAIQLTAIADDEKKDQKFLGYTITDSRSLEPDCYERMVICSMDSSDTIRHDLLSKGVAHHKIVLIE